MLRLAVTWFKKIYKMCGTDVPRALPKRLHRVASLFRCQKKTHTHTHTVGTTKFDVQKQICWPTRTAGGARDSLCVGKVILVICHQVDLVGQGQLLDTGVRWELQWTAVNRSP